ncbi:protein ALP1-like [Ischnura elegans]|uniref:protein ALP1-like n=1 Tax=Ischnura elegans TaxID=197161 RepID=UPI001ED8BFA1|nr:protein ALP1-like [Ischnura elegans]XP_046389402.1 protein ALP1-like [Ischnura elegans]XP_046393763.1 protein ALP1-like [Ischnura elegans]
MDYEWEMYRRRVGIVALLMEGREGRRVRRWQVHPVCRERSRQGDYCNLIREMRLGDEVKYLNFLRMRPWMFQRLLEKVGPLLQKAVLRRDYLSPPHRLALTLRYLASGDSMTSIHYSFRVGLSTVSSIIRETCSALWEVCRGDFLAPTEENWRRLAHDFEERWKFPHCIGAIDGKHVVIQAFENSGSEYYNYKGQHSLVLLGVCDAQNKFTVVDIGAQGRHSDGGIFANSIMGWNFQAGQMNLPPPDKFHQNYEECPYFMVGDEAFGLTEYLLRPYPGRNRGRLTYEQQVFNYRLSLARKTIECTFGMLAQRWRILRKPIIAAEETVDGIVKAAVVLHNFLRDLEEERGERNYLAVGDEDGEGMPDVANAGIGNHTRRAARVRDIMKSYFCNEGAVPWQPQ